MNSFKPYDHEKITRIRAELAEVGMIASLWSTIEFEIENYQI